MMRASVHVEFLLKFEKVRTENHLKCRMTKIMKGKPISHM